MSCSFCDPFGLLICGILEACVNVGLLCRIHNERILRNLQVKEAIKDHLDDFKNADITIDEPKTDDTEFKGRITLSDGNSRNFHGYDLEDDLENIRLRGKPVWTDGIDEVYELVVSREAYRVSHSQFEHSGQ